MHTANQQRGVLAQDRVYAGSARRSLEATEQLRWAFHHILGEAQARDQAAALQR